LTPRQERPYKRLKTTYVNVYQLEQTTYINWNHKERSDSDLVHGEGAIGAVSVMLNRSHEAEDVEQEKQQVYTWMYGSSRAIPDCLK
ncbi:Protein of unknown function, partial [Gryllus bimaculatus]